LEEPAESLQTVAVSANHALAEHEVLDKDNLGEWGLQPAMRPRTVTEALPVELLNAEDVELTIGLEYEKAVVSVDERPKRLIDELSCIPTPEEALQTM